MLRTPDIPANGFLKSPFHPKSDIWEWKMEAAC